MDDFERRRELRRQKREEMRQETERATYQRNDDDEEEAARERRRRARQERQRHRDDAEGHDGTQNSITGEETKSSSITNTDLSADDESALLERLAKREERRQKRLQEAMERQKELDPTISTTLNETISDTKSSRNGENEVQENDTSPKENNTEVYRGQHEVEETETVDKSFKKNDRKEEVVEHVDTEEVEVKQDVQEEAPEEPHIEENQVEVNFRLENVEMSRVGPDEKVRIDAVITREESENEQKEAEDIRKSSEERETHEEEDVAERERVEAEKRAAEERERLEEEAAERERIEAERREAEERDRLEEEERLEAAKRESEEAERKAAKERERLEAEEREQQRKQEEEKKAAEERLKAEQRKAEEERKKLEAEEKRKAEEKKAAEEREMKKAEEKKAAEEKARLEAKKKEDKLKAEEKKDVKADDKQVKGKKLEDKIQPAFLRKQIKDKGGKEELKASWERKTKAQNGESLHEVTPQKLKHMDKFGGAKGQASSDETDRGTKVEAGKKLDELKRRKGESETGDVEKLKQKQQDELDELKKKREERKKIMEEEEQRKKQGEAEKKAKEEEEKKKLKEEIERRRAEAAEKRQKLADDGLSEEKKGFKSFTPKGSAFKIEERAEFLNKSAQKSVKASQPAVVSKIDSRLEQYTSAIGNNKGPKGAKPAPADLPLVTEGVRNIKSMWEKGNVFSSPSGIVSPNKETAGLKVGVSSRINEWLTKTPENNKTPSSSKPSDLRPGDVSGKRNIWEKPQTEKPGSPTKMTTGGKKSDTNGLRFEKEP
ncbi:hypothetical protein GDO78_006432 [Eleutherodactylus coqui]|uniref:Caldesmon n=1 Tax=Eleutherodactylus coqui TaxID=57060 RepID=A0A8J6FNF6_ELECQ|nr:hypothetical protein GDO78_006432 [Eleutherodactylus coqui]